MSFQSRPIQANTKGIPTNAYVDAMKKALLGGYYVPELIDCYFKEDNFKEVKFFVCEPH